jgi:hypothetical protein
MKNQKNQNSIFSQQLDGTVYTAYFLGAVVPLVALAIIANQYVLPEMTDRLSWIGLVGLVFSIASLSLGSFFILRRTMHRTLDQIDSDNRRLGTLLDASSRLSNVTHESEAAATAVRCVADLVNADAVFAFTRGAPDKTPSLIESFGGGASAWLESHAGDVSEMLDLALTNNRPVNRGPDGNSAWGDTAAIAVPLAGDGAPIGALIAVRENSREAFGEDLGDAVSTLTALAAVSMRNSDLRDAQRNFFSHVTDLIVGALDAHLHHQNGHGNRVAQYANRVGREMQLDEAHLQRLHFSALLHDIGMLRIDRSLLQNSKACEKHPIIGGRMLERIRLWSDLAPIVLHHHEHFDGRGYPECLAGDEIPLEARIIAVCEAFDVMVSSSSYKVAMDVPGAVQELVDCSGTQFDPAIVGVFKSLIDRGIIESISS